MKIKQEKQKFQPVTITLETEEELATLYYALLKCDLEGVDVNSEFDTDSDSEFLENLFHKTYNIMEDLK